MKKDNPLGEDVCLQVTYIAAETATATERLKGEAHCA